MSEPQLVNVESDIHTKNASQDVMKVVPAVEQVYFTEGELLPWKGRWWKVRLLILQDGKQVIGLEMLKATAASVKKTSRAARWQKQHPRAIVGIGGSPLPKVALSVQQ